MADEHPTYLSPSELGTKDYWETYYARTLTHISNKHQPTPAPTPIDHTDADDDGGDVDDDDDPGTSWFSEHNAPAKVLEFLTAAEFPLAPCHTLPSGTATAAQPSILDLGTGNGSMLALLRKRGGFRGTMVGVDYSSRSVELARELQRSRGHSAYLSDSESDSETESDLESDSGLDAGGDAGLEEGDDGEIRFEEWDIFDPEGLLARGCVDWFPYEKGGFDIVLDKGTFDAVSLSDEIVEGEGEGPSGSGKVVRRRVCEQYPGLVRKLVRRGGFLVVTSCNWTEDELIRWFTASPGKGSGADADRLVVWGRVEYPKFRFGGQEGQGVCTVCFQRVES